MFNLVVSHPNVSGEVESYMNVFSEVSLVSPDESYLKVYNEF